MHLYEALAQRVADWRQHGYPHDTYPAIAEILEWSANPEGSGFRLRTPQVWALETYWYLRMVANTPHISALYRSMFTRPTDLLTAIGLDHPDIKEMVLDSGVESVLQSVRTDDNFAHRYHLDALRETLTLAYPSYIFALAMGAGKTVLIGAIIASEFAMALEYPDGPFVENALVFAPGKTIIESLRELAITPYDRILPPRFYKTFAASTKMTFTRDGEKDIPVIPGSLFNIVVTNTEKIRIQKETIRKSDLGSLLASEQKTDEARADIANLRLQKIASLPHLAVFSDEAHHTYGQALDAELKKVRKTVDYLAEKTSVVCVVNTTGTPYFQRQPLRDVVIWYGLAQGIAEGILKEVADSIFAYSFNDASTDQFVAQVIEDFFRDYGDVTLPNGAPAKLALYFPQTDDLEELRPAIEAKLTALGFSPAICLRNTDRSTQAEVDAFNRLNDPNAPHRVMLLVNKGTEGWNCPSLFACALARRLRTSNNFVLQAASRCLRQVPGNTKKARIYLSMDNLNTLDNELQETYGETVALLGQTSSHNRQAILQLRKIAMPPLVVRQIVRSVVRKDAESKPLRLTMLQSTEAAKLEKTTLTLSAQAATHKVLQEVGDSIVVAAQPATIDLYAAAVELSAIYRLNLWAIYNELVRLYGPANELPQAHLASLAQQVEEQTRIYEVRQETVEKALALVKLDGFATDVAADGTEVYTAEISYPVDREHLLLKWEALKDRNSGNFGFHYTPYNFDSQPEVNFFDQLLQHINLHPDQIEDIYFTGALTDARKTDFQVQYKDDDGKWCSYTPDFIIRRKDGKCLIVEIKSAQFREATQADLARDEFGQAAITAEGRKAVALRRWLNLNPDRLKYQIIYAESSALAHTQTNEARQFVEET